MKYKERKFKGEVKKLNYRLNIILEMIDELCGTIFRKRIVITSVFRDRGIHKTGRAVDFRVWTFLYGEQLSILKLVNSIFEYDPKRKRYKVLIKHDSGQGLHFHLQIHPGTCLKGLWQKYRNFW